jgi:hypothetical protein
MASDRNAKYPGITGIARALIGVFNDAADRTANLISPSSNKTISIPTIQTVSENEALKAIQSLNGADEGEDGVETLEKVTQILNRLTASQRDNLGYVLNNDQYVIHQLIPLEGTPKISHARLLWEVLRYRLPGFNPTLELLNKNVELRQPPSLADFYNMSPRFTLRQIQYKKRRFAWMSDQRDQWMSLLDEQDLGVKQDASNDAIFNYVYKEPSEDGDKSGGEHARHWLIKTHGNFPVTFNPSGVTDRVLNHWPRFTHERIALYGMYPSLNNQMGGLKYIIQLKKRLIPSIFESLCLMGAEGWNIQRIMDLGVTKESLMAVRDAIIPYAINTANLPMLKVLDYQPPVINRNSDVEVGKAVETLVFTRRDMWQYLFSKSDLNYILPRALAILRINRSQI